MIFSNNNNNIFIFKNHFLLFLLIFYYTKEIQKKINEFCKVRSRFEQILLKYEFLIQQIVRKWRQSKRGYKEVADYFEQIITLLNQNPNAPIETIIDDLVKISKFNYLKIAINHIFFQTYL